MKKPINQVVHDYFGPDAKILHYNNVDSETFSLTIYKKGAPSCLHFCKISYTSKNNSNISVERTIDIINLENASEAKGAGVGWI